MVTNGERSLKIGVAGVGAGAAVILPAMETMPNIDLFAAADINPVIRERFKARYPEARIYDSVEALCGDSEVEAVWVSTPNRFHAPHTIVAAQHKKHVIVEKPIALTLDEVEQMVAAADQNGVKLMAGHTQAYTLPVRAMRKIIASGALGKLCALQVLSYTDWMLRPRSQEELDPDQGGGVPYRQHPHQVDTVRVLGGGRLRSVRGMTGQWMSERRIPGYYTAYLEFEDGTPCTITANGYGYFLAEELMPWAESVEQYGQRYGVEERVRIREGIRSGSRDDEAEKHAMRIGGDVAGRLEGQRRRAQPWLPGDLGVVIANCERGDIRHSKFGLYVYDDKGVHDVDLSKVGGGAQRQAEIQEFYDAVVLEKPLVHDGLWGMATLEVGLAIMQSGRERREIMLTRQIALPSDYAAGLNIPYP